MLLNELVDPTKAREVRSDLTPEVFREKMFKNLKHLGGGISADVYQGKDPNTVIRVSYHAEPNDGYIHYINDIKNSNNPFFPRIKNAKLYKAPAKIDPEQERAWERGESMDQPYDTDYMLVTEIEKLLPLTDPKIKDAVGDILTHSLGIDARADRLDSDLGNLGNEFHKDPYGVINRIKDNTKNPQLKQALDTMSPIWHEFGPDIKADNLMVRLTGHGPQIVFTDPMYPTRMLNRTA